jgi:hypothetical protein
MWAYFCRIVCSGGRIPLAVQDLQQKDSVSGIISLAFPVDGEMLRQV